jgi:hypothetical protein
MRLLAPSLGSLTSLTLLHPSVGFGRPPWETVVGTELLASDGFGHSVAISDNNNESMEEIAEIVEARSLDAGS